MAVVWRHKNKLFLLAVLVGGGYLGAKVINRKLQELQNKEMMVRLESIRFDEHFLGNYSTAVSAVLELLPSLREAIQSELNAEAITDQLRSKPPNKRDLWDNLKVISFTRLVGGAYAYALLSVFMRIQLSILGGRMFKGLGMGSSQNGVDTEIQKQYLSTVQHLLKEGLHALIVAVQAAAENILSQYPLKHQLSCDGVLQLIQDIRHQASIPTYTLHSSLFQRKKQHFLLQYAMPKESLFQQPGVGVGTGEKELLLLGTRDLLENEEVGYVVDRCVEEVFKQTSEQIRESFNTACQQSHSGLAMARVIPLVCDTSLLLFTHPSQSGPLQNILSSNDLQTLSRNIYEAFSKDT